MIEPLVQQTEHMQNQVKSFNFNDLEFLTSNPAAQTSEGVGIIVQMVKSGKIDPWNIDIVDITDKYLSSLFEMKMQNLRVTGKTLLCAAVLLRLKSNVLEGIDPIQFEQPEIDENYDDDWDDDGFEPETINRNNVVSIDEVLQRRSSVRLNRKRVVTLDDLIKQLAFYEELEKKRSLKNAHERAKRRVRSYAKLSTDDIINLASEEFIEKSVVKLQENLTKIFETEEKIELNTLTLLGMDKITTYLALLFLSARAPYELVQEEFYGDLYVRPCKPVQEGEQPQNDAEG